jgi:hypothetical protein
MTVRDHPRSDLIQAPSIFLSASVPDGHKEYPGSERHQQTTHAQWIRDAVLAVSREALKRGFRLRFGAHPSISPMILMVAREFPPAATPPIEVYQSRFFLGKYPAETYELAKPPEGVLVEVDAEERNGAPDQQASLVRMRNELIQRPGLVAALFIGGMDGVTEEARSFRALHGAARPAYALASAGGAAADLLDPQHGGDPAAFSGNPAAPVDVALLQEQRAGYTRVARAIFDAIEAAMRAAPPATAP